MPSATPTLEFDGVTYQVKGRANGFYQIETVNGLEFIHESAVERVEGL